MQRRVGLAGGQQATTIRFRPFARHARTTPLHILRPYAISRGWIIIRLVKKRPPRTIYFRHTRVRSMLKEDSCFRWNLSIHCMALRKESGERYTWSFEERFYAYTGSRMLDLGSCCDPTLCSMLRSGLRLTLSTKFSSHKLASLTSFQPRHAKRHSKRTPGNTRRSDNT